MKLHAYRLPSFAALVCAAVMLSACNDAIPVDTASNAKALPEVAVVSVEPVPRSHLRELPGRIAPTQVAEVRARVGGIVMARLFKQGADVKAGDVLYRIDPARFEVELDATKAALAKAEAALEQAERQSIRIDSLMKTNTASQSQYDNAIGAFKQAQADVAARRADVARANLELDYTFVRSPIDGRIGRALVTEGALVSAGASSQEASHLATVQQLNPIYVDFTQSAGELQQLMRDFESGALERVSTDATAVKLLNEDGSVYPYPGKLLFSDVTVDPSTGKVTLRGEFPNPKLTLLPGMYVRVQIEQGIDADSLAVPQQAIRRNDTGASEVYVVRADNRAVLQPVKTGRVSGDDWIVQSGLEPGARVVVEGFQKFSAGDIVNPVPWQTRVSASADEAGRSPKN